MRLHCDAEGKTRGKRKLHELINLGAWGISCLFTLNGYTQAAALSNSYPREGSEIGIRRVSFATARNRFGVSGNLKPLKSIKQARVAPSELAEI